MKTKVNSATKVARVGVNVRLYFDVPIETTDKDIILQAALAELQLTEEFERIRVKQLRFPAVYPVDDWPALKAKDFDICDICSTHEVNREARFTL